MARIVVEKGQPGEIIIRFPYDPALIIGRIQSPLDSLIARQKNNGKDMPT